MSTFSLKKTAIDISIHEDQRRQSQNLIFHSI